MKLLIKESYNAGSCFCSVEQPDRIASNWIGPTKVGKVSINDYMRYEKGQDATIEYMTPKEYLSNCAKAKGISYDTFVRNMDKGKNAEDISDYATAMKNGDKFPIPYVDFVSNQQEGRHRALAVEKAFGPDATFPVIVITNTQPTEEELIDYAERRWGKDNANYFIKELYAKYFPQLDNYISEEEPEEVMDKKQKETKYDDLDDLNSLDIDLNDFDVLGNNYDDKFADYLDDYMNDNNINDSIDFIIASMDKWYKLSDEQKNEMFTNRNKLYDMLDKVSR